jgi:hypothetical protein
MPQGDWLFVGGPDCEFVRLSEISCIGAKIVGDQVEITFRVTNKPVAQITVPLDGDLITTAEGWIADNVTSVTPL